MAITHRKGDYNDYDPSRMRPAEFGITLMNDPKAVDGRAVHIAFAAGEDKTLMTFEDAEGMIEDAAEEATAAATSQAQQYATNSQNSATESRSYAKGGTSSRSGEDTDNAMYYKNQAANSATAASNSAAAASGSASTASTKASEAATSATNASGSATAAATSAGQAASSATAASGSATAAADSAEDAQEMSYTAEAWAVGTKNGIDVGSSDPQYHNNSKYYAEQAEAVAESIPEDYSDLSADVDQLKNALITDSASGEIASFPDGGDGFPVRDLKVQMEPIQDLHGYDHPWSAGGGKNLLPLNVDTIKTKNGGVSAWNGNSYTTSGLTFTLNVDDAGNLQKITVNGTATADIIFYFIQDASVSINATVIVTIPNASKGGFRCDGTWIDLRTTSTTIENVSVGQALWTQFLSGRTYNNADISPMICLASATDPTVFAPYSNICPISGRDSVTVTRTGVNIWDEEWESGYCMDSNGEAALLSNSFVSKNYIHCFPNTSYYFKNTNNVCFYDESKNFINRVFVGTRNYTTPSNAHYMKFDNRSTSTYNHDISINYPSTDTDYHAGHVQTVEITLGQTVYGGTLDVTTGVLTVDRATQALGDLTWYYNTSLGGGPAFYTIGLNYVKLPASGSTNILCSMFKPVTETELYSSPTETGIICVNFQYLLQIRDNRYSDESTFKTAMQAGNVQLVYELSTPQTYQLTPTEVTTLLGQNNVWSDADSVSVDYVADTKLYIEQLTEPDADMIADMNITSGRYFMVGNSLYLATANIANDSAITVGVNCTRTNLAEALNAINA